VITVTTVDRVEFRPWPPSSAASPTAVGTHVKADDELYIGKHRKAGGRSLSLLRMFYSPRHRAG
jgi:hypothetical protein